MESKLISQALESVQADAIAVAVFAEESAPPQLAAFSTWIDELRTSGEFTGKPGEMAVLHQPAGQSGDLAAKRLVVVGVGKRAAFDASGLRKAVGSTVRSLKQKG